MYNKDTIKSKAGSRSTEACFEDSEARTWNGGAPGTMKRVLKI